ncbi:hypothetical protein K0M31_004633 [Melipona bicolor]|uniref:Uncharacterized protein n=1 Tax=Melipona bicolor TaxID=60889 RepID=A0AA40FX66_9HYME|nr:hypothetical protein K0M31_004633 [Melipona bicolor]
MHAKERSLCLSKNSLRRPPPRVLLDKTDDPDDPDPGRQAGAFLATNSWKRTRATPPTWTDPPRPESDPYRFQYTNVSLSQSMTSNQITFYYRDRRFEAMLLSRESRTRTAITTRGLYYFSPRWPFNSSLGKWNFENRPSTVSPANHGPDRKATCPQLSKAASAKMFSSFDHSPLDLDNETRY